MTYWQINVGFLRHVSQHFLLPDKPEIQAEDVKAPTDQYAQQQTMVAVSAIACLIVHAMAGAGT